MGKQKGTRGNPNWRKGGPSPNPSGRKRNPTRVERTNARLDGWESAISGIGSATYDKRVGHDFAVRQVDHALAADLWRGNDLAARVVETIPSEMFREGFELRIREAPPEAPAGETIRPQPGDEREDSRGRRYRMDASGSWRRVVRTDAGEKDLCDLVKSRWEELDVMGALWKLNCYNRAYGGGAIILGVNDGSSDWSKPLDLDKVKSLDWLTVVEPRLLQPAFYYDDVKAAKYGEVAIWTVNPDTRGQPIAKSSPQSIDVHETRMIVMTGIQVTRRQVAPQTGFGDNVLSRFYRTLRDFDLSFEAAAILLVDFAPAVLKIKGLAEIFAGDSDEAFKAKMRQVELSRSVARLAIVDSEEEFERKTVNVAGLPEMLDRMMTRCAAAADMPLTLLMGQSPAGLNATGESDIRFFYDRVAQARRPCAIRPLEYITKILLRIEGAEPEHWSIEGKPLWQPTELERAQARKAQAEVDAIYITNGVLGAQEVAVSRFRGESFSFETVVDFDARLAGEPPAESPAKTEQEIETEAKEAEAAAAELEIAAKKAEPRPRAE